MGAIPMSKPYTETGAKQWPQVPLLVWLHDHRPWVSVSLILILPISIYAIWATGRIFPLPYPLVLTPTPVAPALDGSPRVYLPLVYKTAANQDDWLTYVDQRNGYSIKYPKTW